MLGKHSGRHAVQRRCEQIGHTLDRHELDVVYRAVIAHADREKVVSDADLAAIVARAIGVGAASGDRRPPPSSPTSPRPRPKSATATESNGIGKSEM